MNVTKDDLIGKTIGIYTIVSESDEKTSDGYKKYNVICDVCKQHFCYPLKTIKRVKTCRHNHDCKDMFCLNCGNLIERGDLTPYKYSKKRFCCQSCSATYTNKNRQIKEKKRCKSCGKELSNNQKTYCDFNCQQEYQYKEYIRKWKSGEISGTTGNAWIDVSVYIRRYLFDKYDNKCSKCGWSEINPFTNTLPLEVEHIDGDATNNKEENLTLLCPNCHSLTKTYRGANKGNGTRDIKWVSRSGTTNVSL